MPGPARQSGARSKARRDRISRPCGTTATALVNMQSVAERHGPSRLALLLVPVTGAFLIDLANAATIQAFLALPFFGTG